MHTDTSLKVFSGVTKEAGRLLRHFTNTVCNNFNTEETPTETASRVRREEREIAKAKKEGKMPTGKKKKWGKTKKRFNLSTYKLHALGDYPWTIWHFGTTDSYSTQRVSDILHLGRYLTASYRVRWSTNGRNVFMGERTSGTLSVKLQHTSHARGDCSPSINASSWDPNHESIGTLYLLPTQANIIMFLTLVALRWTLRHLFVRTKMTSPWKYVLPPWPSITY